MQTTTRVKNLVLDAGPLLSLTPLKDLAELYLTVPQVLDELKDRRAREHFERLALTAGVRIEIRSPDAVSLVEVTEFAKKTGDYAVLSHADLCVLALTYAVHKEAEAHEQHRADLARHSGLSQATQAGMPDAPHSHNSPDEIQGLTDTIDSIRIDTASKCPSLPNTGEAGGELPAAPLSETSSDADSEPAALFDDPSSEDDGAGEWITPSNVELHKSRALELLPAEEVPNRVQRGNGRLRGSANEPGSLAAGCMTADFAMQNVLLQMGLNLIGVEGKRISRVKTWVLRCHACFKICKDPTKRFCPTCGNPTLLRTSVTISSPSASTNAEPKLQVHLKRNFQWRTRGTKYPIPAPKPGSSKTGAGEGLILREDQTDWLRAEKRAEGQRLKDEKKLVKAISSSSGTGGVKLDWMDPDWLPEMLVVGAGGKGRSHGKGDMPPVGYGRKNPNERKRRKR
ncbi:Nin one binding Zn-ribbon like-domain-containing protein [Gautieria morchelliformis]|nr:Nin one binding Zn-ribbon like-domain-containing protein [Gautieria morchelliformis]